jgi:hypothetical protein
MDPLLDRILRPETLGVFIPILAILIGGIVIIAKVLRGGSRAPEDLDQIRAELEQLRVEVNELRRYLQQMPTVGSRN